MPFYFAWESTLYSICIHSFTLITLILYYCENLSSKPTIHPQYDYIIVGSGTAGSLIAHRLATETNCTYLLLEAGGRGTFLSHIPVLGPLLQRSVYDWQYETVPQDNACLSMTNQKCKWPRGKIFGGSAILNNMIHLRGNLSHYSLWFDKKLSEVDIKKHFEFIENHILYASNIKHKSKLADAVMNAALELGYPINDFNKKFGIGFMETQVNQIRGSRWSTSHTLRNGKHNLITNAMVDKVLIDEHNKASGVQYRQNGRVEKVEAKRGVILSAGAINTPQILLLSGIGPKDHLLDVGIKPIRNLPVGRNLQDHITTGLDLILFNQTLDLSPWDVINPMNLANYFLNGQGPLTYPGCEVTGMLSTKNTQSADLQFMVLPVGVTSDKGLHLKNSVGITDRAWEEYFAKIVNNQSASIVPIVIHPKSKGNVKLNMMDPTGPPLINPKYFNAKEDVDTLVKGLEIVQQFVNTHSMKKLGAYINPQPYPGCEQLKLFSKEYWECYVKEFSLTSFHPVGTCKMGPEKSADSVVNTDFKVLGVKNLYVVDASVMPNIPSVNVNAAVALIANIFFENHFGQVNMLEEKSCERINLFQNMCFEH